MSQPRPRRRRRRQPNGRGDHVRVRGRFELTATTVVSGSAQFSSTITFGGALLDASTRLALYPDLYSYYRVHNLRVRFLNSQTGASEPGFASFVPGQASSVPTTLSQAMECDRSAMVMPGQTVPSVLHITRQDLAGRQPWYECAGSSVNSPGVLILGTYAAATGLATADTLHALIEYDVEFKDLTEPSVEMASSLRHRRIGEPVLIEHDDGAHFSCNSSRCSDCKSVHRT